MYRFLLGHGEHVAVQTNKTRKLNQMANVNPSKKIFIISTPFF
jgi:hypothetical protein